MWGTFALFSTTQHTLHADGFRGTTLGVVLIIGLLSAWGAWFLGAQVALYVVSDTARLEISHAAHPVDALVVAVGHNEYRHATLKDLRALCRGDQPVLADVKSLYDRHAAAAAGFTVFRL